jgi:hypothetical protein
MNNKIILSEEFIRMQRLAGLITENEYKQKINEEYTLKLKSINPGRGAQKFDKTFIINSKPTTLLGGNWDAEEVLDIVKDPNLLSGDVAIELIDSSGKIIKKGATSGWYGDIPSIRNIEEEVSKKSQTDPVAEKDAEQGLKQALAALNSGVNSIKPSPQDKEVKESLALTLGLIAGAPGLINLLGKVVNIISTPFQNIEDQNKGTIVGNALKKMGHKWEDAYIGIIGDMLKVGFPSKYQMQDVHDKTSALYDAAHGIYATILIGAAVASGVGAIHAHSQIAAGLEGGLSAFKTKEVIDLAQKIAAA